VKKHRKGQPEKLHEKGGSTVGHAFSPSKAVDETKSKNLRSLSDRGPMGETGTDRPQKEGKPKAAGCKTSLRRDHAIIRTMGCDRLTAARPLES